jgi:synaptobrevin homolog YKT6
MTLYSLLIFDSEHTLIYSNHNLTEFNFLFRSTIKESIEDFAKKIIHRVESNRCYKINEKIADNEFIIYGQVSNISCIVITSKDYPSTTAFQLLNVTKQSGLTIRALDDLFKQYQNPVEADKLQKIKYELDDTHIIMLNSLDKLREREADLKNLIQKTDDLVADSTKFWDDARDLNRCCTLI